MYETFKELQSTVKRSREAQAPIAPSLTLDIWMTCQEEKGPFQRTGGCLCPCYKEVKNALSQVFFIIGGLWVIPALVLKMGKVTGHLHASQSVLQHLLYLLSPHITISPTHAS